MSNNFKFTNCMAYYLVYITNTLIHIYGVTLCGPWQERMDREGIFLGAKGFFEECCRIFNTSPWRRAYRRKNITISLASHLYFSLHVICPLWQCIFLLLGMEVFMCNSAWPRLNKIIREIILSEWVNEFITMLFVG